MRARRTQKVIRQDSPTAASDRAVREAAQRLVYDLDSVHGSDAFRHVWAVAQMHCGPYRGPQYGPALERLRAALKGRPSSAPPQEQP